jgi:hypothetical protein
MRDFELTELNLKAPYGTIWYSGHPVFIATLNRSACSWLRLCFDVGGNHSSSQVKFQTGVHSQHQRLGDISGDTVFGSDA